MNEIAAEEKQKKRLPNKRQVLSAPNIPLTNAKVKANETIMEALEEAKRKPKREIEIKPATEGKKKSKAGKKKLGNKEVDKLLLEAKMPNEEEARSKDYQFLIKKNIVKIMNVGKKGGDKEVAAAKNPGLNKLLQRAASDAVKKEPDEQKKPKKKLREAPADDPSKEKNLLRRAITATLPRRREPTTKQQRPLSSTDPQTQQNLAEEKTKRRKSNMQKIKNIFKAFKDPSGETVSPKIKASDDLKGVELKKAILANKKLTERILPMPIGKDGPIEYVRVAKKKKAKGEAKTGQEKAATKGKGDKKKRILPHQLLEDIVNA